jgi:hypothetical protein
MTTISFLLDVNAPNAQKTFDAVAARLDKLDASMKATRELSVGNASAMATIAKAQIAADRLRDRVTNPMDLSIRGAQTAEARLLELEATSDKLNSKLSNVGDSGEKAATGGLQDFGSSLGKLSNIVMPAAIAAGVALSPVIVTAGVGLGGFAAAAASSAKPILTAAQAAGGLKANLDTLNPAQQQVARGILSLQGDFDKFAKSMQPEVFSAFNSGLGIANTLLHGAEPVAAAAGKALDGVLAALSTDLHSSQWQQFFGWMAQNAGPDVQLLGNTFIDLANDLPPLLENLQPLGQALLTATDSGAKGIGDLANSLHDLAEQTGVSWLGQEISKLTHDIPAGNKNIFGMNSAFGQTSKSASAAASGVGKFAGSTLKAAPQVGSLSGDLGILASSTSSATTQLSAYSDLWNIFVGKAVGDQQAVLDTSQAFKTFTAQVGQSGAKSLTAQSDFLAYMTQIGAGLSTLQKNGASVRAINGYYQTNIGRLNSLHKLTPAQRADVQGLTKDYNAWASSTQGLNKNTLTAAGSLKNNFLSQLTKIGANTPGVSKDVGALANAVLKTGTQSSATRSDRSKLITDLENAGLSAKGATGLVNSLQSSIGRLKGKNVNVGVLMTGSGKVSLAPIPGVGGFTKAQLLLGEGRAAGGAVTGPGGPKSDAIPIWASNGEYMMQASAVAKYGLPLMHALNSGKFASGGQISAISSNMDKLVSWTSANESSWTGNVEKNWATTAEKAWQSAWQKSLTTEMTGGLGALPHGSLGGTLAEVQYAASLLGKYGWPNSMITALEKLWTQESGWNPYAVNPSSGAYGIPQALGKGHPYNLGDAKAQIAWGLNYIAGRYGNPANAWAHETAAGWYGHGGKFAAGQLIGVGDRGRELVSFDQPGTVLSPEQSAALGTRGGDGPLVGTLNVNHVPGFTSTADIENALTMASRQVRLARR